MNKSIQNELMSVKKNVLHAKTISVYKEEGNNKYARLSIWTEFTFCVET